MSVRARAGAGLTRPEMAVLLAGAKRGLTASLLASGVPDQPALRGALAEYFPASLATRFDHLLDRHRLRRELDPSVVANEVVDRMGVTSASRLAADTGSDPSAVAAAWWIGREVVGAAAWWEEVDGDEGLGRRRVHDQVTTVRTVLEALARDYLRRGDGADIAAGVARDRPAAVALESALAAIGTGLRRRRGAAAEALVDDGIEPDAAVQWARLGELEIAADVAEVARDTGRPSKGGPGTGGGGGQGLAIDQLMERLRQVAVVEDDRWSHDAVRGLLDDLHDLRRQGACRAPGGSPRG